VTDPIPSTRATAKALFLDRDGVINVDRDYVHRVEDFAFVDGIFDLCRAAQRDGCTIVVITNQAGVARGKFTEDDLARVTRFMLDTFAREGVTIAQVYCCVFHPEAPLERYRADSFDRKPNPGMLLRARDELAIDLAASALIGDRLTDIEAGRRAGVGRLCFLQGVTRDVDVRADDPALTGVIVVRSLAEAAARLNLR
jgi:D-glycero-D-manno-heptose 1,7-bisphosphate phosphatase